MGLNIKNEATVALIRELARRTGQTLTGAVESAVRARITDLADEPDRSGDVDRLLADLRTSITDEERAAVRAASCELYDESGLPL